MGTEFVQRIEVAIKLLKQDWISPVRLAQYLGTDKESTLSIIQCIGNTDNLLSNSAGQFHIGT